MIPAVMAASPSGYGDVSGHWAESAIDRWSGYGVVGGVGDNLFAPDATLTRGQAAQIFANLLGLTAAADLGQYVDVAAGSWYYDAIAKCVAAGILTGTGAVTMNPDDVVTREQLFVMFARALSIEPKASASSTFTDSASVSSWAAGYINALADMGAIQGSGDGSLNPGGDINRASVMAVLDQTISGYANTDNATVGGTSGIVLVVADNVTVMGDVDNLVVVGGSAGVSGSTVGTVTVSGDNASVSVGGSASVGQVNVTGANAAVTVSGQASVTTVTVADTAANATVTVNDTAAVTTVDSAAAGVTISGTGTVETANVSGSNTTVNTSGTDLTVAQGATGVTENGNAVSGGSSVTTEGGQTTPEQPDPTPSQPVTPPIVIPTYYTVTLSGENNIMTIQVERGATLTEEQLDRLVYEQWGYEVGSWYSDYELTTLYDFDAPVTEDMYVYFILGSYTLTYVIEDAEVDSVELAYGDPISLPQSENEDYTWTWYWEPEFIREFNLDTMLARDLTLYGQWSHKESGLKGHGTEADPFQLSTAQDIDHMISSSTTTYYYEMLNDIELTSDTVQKRTYGVNAFNGVLNGNNHTLSGLNQQETYYALFYQTYGNTTIRNLTIDYNCQSLGSDALLVFNAGGTLTFENVTTSGYIAYNYDGRNQSPFMYTNTSNSTVTFSDCVNECDIYSSSGYNSAFVGYSAWGNNSTFNFVNCVNRGELRSKWVAVFFGNPSSWGSNVTINITNCSNEGTVIGTERAGLFCWGASGNLTEEALSQYNDQITNSGTCEVNKLDGFSAAVDDDKQITITRESSDTSNVAYYSVAISLYTQTYNENGVKTGTDMFAVEKRVDIGDAANGAVINTGIYRYDFRQLASSELTGIASAANITLSYAVGTNNYTVVTSDYDVTNSVDIVTVDETMYYLFKDSTAGELGYSILANASPSVTVYAYDASGKLLGSVSAK